MASSSREALPLLLSQPCLCLTLLFPLAIPSSPRSAALSRASLRIQTRQPSTSTTIHRQRLRRLALLEMHRLRRMFENVFSPSSLSLTLYPAVSPAPPRSNRHPSVTDGNLATDLLPETLTKRSATPSFREFPTFIPPSTTGNPFFVSPFSRHDRGNVPPASYLVYSIRKG